MQQLIDEYRSLQVARFEKIQLLSDYFLNKFTIKGGLENAVKDEQKNNGFQILPVNLLHALYLENLPPHHKDPFDRLLISQAISRI